LTAKVLNKVFDYAINNSGIIEAKSLVDKDGQIILDVEGAKINNEGGLGSESIMIKLDNAELINKEEKVIEATREIIVEANNNSSIINQGELYSDKVVIDSQEGDFINNDSGIIEAKEIYVKIIRADIDNRGIISSCGNSVSSEGGLISLNAEEIYQRGTVIADGNEEGWGGRIEIISTVFTFLGENSRTSASCPFSVGNGGRIFINSLKGDVFVGRNAIIDVSSGNLKGNAGSIEIIAYKQLGFYGVLSGRAPPGYSVGVSIFDPQIAYISGVINTNLTVDAWENIIINGDITLANNVILTLLADHTSPTEWDKNYNPGKGEIINAGNYVISTQEGITNTTVILKAGSGIGTSIFPIKTNIDKLFAEINPHSYGSIYIEQGEKDLIVSSISTPSGTIRLNSYGSILDDGDDTTWLSANDIILYSSKSIGNFNELGENFSDKVLPMIDIALGDGYLTANANDGVFIAEHNASVLFTSKYSLISNNGNIGLANLTPYKEVNQTILGVTLSTVPRGKERRDLILDLASLGGEEVVKLMVWAGIRTVRTYYPPSQDLLDTFAKYGIKVIVGFPNYDDRIIGSYYSGGQYDGKSLVDIERGGYLNYIAQYKEHPAILMWELGNEYNLLFRQYPQWAPKGSLEGWWERVSIAVELIRNLDNFHKISTTLGDSGSYLDSDILSLNNTGIDIIGFNFYKWDDFSSAITQITSVTEKLFYFSEAGADSYDMIQGKEDEINQREAILNIWESVKDKNNQFLGVTYMSWQDEWWKPEGSNNSYTHDTDGWYQPGVPYDRFANEEYWGWTTVDHKPKQVLLAIPQIWGKGDIIIDNTISGDKLLLISEGSILDGNGEGLNVDANSLILFAKKGIGKVDALETSVSSLQVTNTVEGDIMINNLDRVVGDDLALIDLLNLNYAIKNSGGSVSIYSLPSNSSSSDLVIKAKLITQGGDLTIISADDICQFPKSVISTNGGNVSIIANYNNLGEVNFGIFQQVDGASIDSGSGNITIQTYDGIELSNLFSQGVVTLTTYKDGIRDGGESLTDIVANKLIINSVGGVGINFDKGEIFDDSLEIQVANLQITNLGSGNININNTGNLNISLMENKANKGKIDLNVNGDLAVTKVSTNGEVIITVKGDITDGGKDTDITAERLVISGKSIGSSSNYLDTKIYNLQAQTSNGSIFIDNKDTVLNIISATALGTNRVVNIENTESITIGSITAPLRVTLKSNSSLYDDGDDYTYIVTPNLILYATNGIGSTNALDTQLSTIEATNIDNGIWIMNKGGLILNRVSNTNGWIDIFINSNLTVNNDMEAKGDITLTAGENKDRIADNININANVTSTGGNIILKAGDEIIQQAGTTIKTLALNKTITIIAGSNDLDNIGGITQNNNSQIVTNKGDIIIYAYGDIKLALLDATYSYDGGEVYITSYYGAIIDNDLGVVPEDYDIKGKSLYFHSNSFGGTSPQEIDLLLLVDNTPPLLPTNFTYDRSVGVWVRGKSNDNTIEISWIQAIDPSEPSSGIKGYYYIWDNSDNTTPNYNSNFIESTITSVISPPLLDGTNHYFHLRTIDNSGNWSTDTVHIGPFFIDTTPPTIIGIQSPQPNANGWNNTLPVKVSYIVNDVLSGIDNSQSAGYSDDIFTTETMGSWAEGVVYDLAGNSASISVLVKIDTTPPVITAGTAIGMGGNNGWYLSDVTVPFSAEDNLSGFAPSGVLNINLGSKTTIGEGIGLTVSSDSITDLAGNTAKVVVSGPYKVDKTDPLIEVIWEGTEGLNGWYVSNVKANISSRDDTFGISSPLISYRVDQGNWVDDAKNFYLSDGVHTVDYQVVNKAGRRAQGTTTVRIDTTPPEVKITRKPESNTNGWNNTDVLVEYEASDKLSGLSSPFKGSYLFSKEGENQECKFTVFDLAGNYQSVNIGNINIDKTSPTININRSSLPNSNGWHNRAVTYSYIGMDDLSGIDIFNSQLNDDVLNIEGGGQLVEAFVKDLAGNQTYFSEIVNIDWTPPQIIAILSPDYPNGLNNWYITDVNVHFIANDNLSGIDKFTPDILITTEGIDQSVTGIATDKAGNLTNLIVRGINIDKTPPIITVTKTPPSNQNGWNSSLPVKVSFNAYDNLSGIDYLSLPQDITYTTEIKGDTLVATACDLAGNRTVYIETMNIDVTPPKITIISPKEGKYNTPQQLLYSVEDNLDPAPKIIGPLSGKVYYSGYHNVSLTAIDLADNKNSTQIIFSVIPLKDTFNQLVSSLILKHPHPFRTLTMYRFNTLGFVYFYHPLTLIDYSLFEKLELDREGYEFIEGRLSFTPYMFSYFNSKP
ncbi:MAG: hypothetical protein NC820_00180, partial [Candidatus Omnitrophica bacterium]|nr:hypothetical protein [Candidatus Omnitrophota bacterium]